MGFFSSRDKPRVPRSQKPRDESLSTDPEKLKNQVAGRIISQSIKEMPGDELLSMGRRLIDNMLDSSTDPEKELLREELKDPEFRREWREALLEQKRAEADAKRGRRRRDDDRAPYYEPERNMFTELAEDELLERIRNPKAGDDTNILAMLGQALAPGGAIALLLGGLAQAGSQIQGMQPRSMIASNPPIGLSSGDDSSAEEIQLEGTPAVENQRLLMGLFSANQIAQLLSEDDMEKSGRVAWKLVSEGLREQSPMHQAQILALLNQMVALDVGTVVILLNEYRQYPEWEGVIRFIDANRERFAEFQKALANQLSSQRVEEEEEEAIEL